MKLSHLLFGFACMILLTACPYESSVPIDEPSVKTPEKIIGKWMEAGNVGTENATYYIVTKVDKYVFNIEKNEYNSTEEKIDTTNYSTFVSKIGDLEFLNIKETKGTSYYLHKIEWKADDEFIMHEVTNNIAEKFESSEELKAFIEKHSDLSFFYNSDPVTYIKRN